MSRRAFLFTVLGATLGALPRSEVAADLDGARRLERANRRCWLAGERRERDGLTARETRYLQRLGCKKESGQWMSDRVYTAEDER